MFEEGTDEGFEEKILSILEMIKCGGEGNILACPTLRKGQKQIFFQYIKDRMWKKVQGWKEKLLDREEGAKGKRKIIISDERGDID